MHYIQQGILNLAHTSNLGGFKLREIGEKIGVPHPQKVKHHLNQLLKKGFLKSNKDRTIISPIEVMSNKNNLFISIPIVGSANCGQASLFAEENIEGYLQVSKSLVPNYKPDEMFVLKAIGNSMNKADINGKTIDDGDYVLVSKKPLVSFDNKYVLSIINGAANIKKLVRDDKNQQIVLNSESTQDYPPIFINKNDFKNTGYLVNGEVIQIFKKC